jgi:hypothetical protein
LGDEQIVALNNTGIAVVAVTKSFDIGGDTCSASFFDDPCGRVMAMATSDTIPPFNRQFKRLTSLTPREYRANFRREAI